MVIQEVNANGLYSTKYTCLCLPSKLSLRQKNKVYPTHQIVVRFSILTAFQILPLKPKYQPCVCYDESGSDLDQTLNSFLDVKRVWLKPTS